LLVVVLTAASAPVTALGDPAETAAIGGNAFGNAQGLVMINQAAGDGNAQANVAAVAGPGRVTAGAAVNVGRTASLSRATVTIGGGALAHASGLLQINQVGGAGNAQANLVTIGPGAQLDDAALFVVSATRSAPASASSAYRVSVDHGALATPGGILQLNQTAGTGNRTVNALDLHLHP
jgi:hypothetical protein